MAITDELAQLREQTLARIAEADTSAALESVRVAVLGKAGTLTGYLRGMGKVAKEERAVVGKTVNEVRNAVEEALEARKKKLAAAEMEAAIDASAVDVTLPGRAQQMGTRHLINAITDEVSETFLGLGYTVVHGPEVETDYYNFEALNAMEDQKPPIYIIAPGKVYRRDVADPSHLPQFTQIEGLVIDKGISFGDLKGTLDYFCKQMFGPDRKTRFRAHYFPFTEPSAEADVSCGVCGGTGHLHDGERCRMCKGTGWLEILGCGMVDPNVLTMSGIDPEEYSGFAFGVGVERVACLKYNVPDLRMLPAPVLNAGPRLSSADVRHAQTVLTRTNSPLGCSARAELRVAHACRAQTLQGKLQERESHESIAEMA